MALDKELKTLGKKQYHIHLKPGDIGKYVLLPGDPARSDRVAKYLDNAEFVAENREHRTFTGYYKGVKISVTSTGMGCPSATIAAEELMNIGAECLIRIGSSAALQDDIKIGDLMISTGSMKNEGTSRFYVPVGTKKLRLCQKQFIVSSKNCRQKLFKSQFTFNSFQPFKQLHSFGNAAICFFATGNHLQIVALLLDVEKFEDWNVCDVMS